MVFLHPWQDLQGLLSDLHLLLTPRAPSVPGKIKTNEMFCYDWSLPPSLSAKRDVLYFYCVISQLTFCSWILKNYKQYLTLTLLAVMYWRMQNVLQKTGSSRALCCLKLKTSDAGQNGPFAKDTHWGLTIWLTIVCNQNNLWSSLIMRTQKKSGFLVYSLSILMSVWRH